MYIVGLRLVVSIHLDGLKLVVSIHLVGLGLVVSIHLVGLLTVPGWLRWLRSTSHRIHYTTFFLYRCKHHTHLSPHTSHHTPHTTHTSHHVTSRSRTKLLNADFSLLCGLNLYASCCLFNLVFAYFKHVYHNNFLKKYICLFKLSLATLY